MPKPVYLGGEIKRDYRGSETVTIVKDRDAGHGLMTAFDYPLGGEEFTHITGAGAIRSPVQRIYHGISRECAKEILISINKKKDCPDFRLELLSIDKRIVNSPFIV